MELQLGLTLSSTNTTIAKGLELGLAQTANADDNKIIKKRIRSTTFGEDDGENLSTLLLASPSPYKQQKLLPLFSWASNDDDEDRRHCPRKNCCKDHQQQGSCSNVLVGWPPVKSWRKKLMVNNPNATRNGHEDDYEQDQGCVLNGDDSAVTNNSHCGTIAAEKSSASSSCSSMYVKVSMEGMQIGRKVDLNLYSSYQTLTAALITMFIGTTNYNQKSVMNEMGGNTQKGGYTLTYQDTEGDWLLVGDVPWQSFIESVQRLKIIKNDIN